MINEIRTTVCGNVTRTPEVRNRKLDGKPFTVVPIAVNSRRFDTESQKFVETGTTFIDVLCGNGLGANALASLEIGTPVLATGRFRVREWETENAKGVRPQIVADSLGVDLSWGTASYAKGMKSYPAEDEFGTGLPPASEGGPADASGGGSTAGSTGPLVRAVDGYQVDSNGEVLRAPGDVATPRSDGDSEQDGDPDSDLETLDESEGVGELAGAR